LVSASTADRGAASGIYLACYFLGGLVGSANLGQIFVHAEWPATVDAIALSLRSRRCWRSIFGSRSM
jgi:YNFM family putative membrane transporter